MPRWRKGEAVIDRLLVEGALSRVPADKDAAAELRRVAERHLASASALAGTDPDGSLALAYDAARKGATSLLALQGLRPTTAGGHLAVVDAVEAQFGGAPGLASLGRLRRRRNQVEYPDPAGFDPVTGDDVEDALAIATDTLHSVNALVDSGRLGVY